jgi:diamine N-acetyltransferase
MSPVTFVLLTPSDAHALSKIALRAYRDHYLDYWHDRGEWYMQHSFAPEQLTAELADPNARYFMVHLNAVPVGFIKVNLDKALDHYSAADSLELERIYLVKEATGTGVGQAAMQFVEQLARSHNKKLLWLKSMDTSPALGFYKRVGFQTHSTLRLTFPQMKEELRGMIVLQRSVIRDQ